MATESRWAPLTTQWSTDDPSAVAALSDPTYEAGGWRAIYALEQVDGRPVIASVRLEPQDLESSAPELSATLARELMRPGEALRMVREHLADPLTRALAQMFS